MSDDGGWVGLVPPRESGEQERLVAAAGGDDLATALAAAPNAFYESRTGQDEAAAVVLGWPADRRRGVLLRLHDEAVRSGGPPRYVVGPLVERLDRGLRWSREDLVWMLHRVRDELALDDGEVYQLPVRVAAALGAADLRGLGPALDGLLTELSRGRLPATLRRDLAARLGLVVERVTAAAVPPQLLHAGDAFGPLARARLAEVLGADGAREVLLHAASLTKPTPSKAWTAAAPADTAGVAGAVLDLFAEFDGALHADNDSLLRGLTCLAALDPGDAATERIGRAAGAAAAADPRWAGYPYAPRTAAAAVEILAGRGGDAPPAVLSRLASTVRNKALLGRVRAGLDRIAAGRAAPTATDGGPEASAVAG
ncbi:hypothetical protein KZZ52_31070 [Dactylosporangium sp. AC04546]|uniref:hypothetical protein n=1 Tax=Dactylosporangium sp. AC04546 TaxID=2862460 RepID=UPI001EDFFEEA|nr:hypothetical protein [Dactylosporangium sp. AC04546]WVK78436.1 hypothetical protein KZZ52_31070 [Dactylosporangium sp. AC04546]